MVLPRQLVNIAHLVGQDGILRADGVGALRMGLLVGARPVDNRPQDAILPHCVPALTLGAIDSGGRTD